ncbi:MAG: hypothetical protein AAFR41_12385, partial [Pseudomonadota bacterium]
MVLFHNAEPRSPAARVFHRALHPVAGADLAPADGQRLDGQPKALIFRSTPDQRFRSLFLRNYPFANDFVCSEVALKRFQAKWAPVRRPEARRNKDLKR